MPCDTRRLVGQSIRDRIKEVEETAKTVEKGLVNGKIKVVVGPQGAVAFQGLSEADRNRTTDACIFRRIMSTGSAMARMKLAQAGNVNKQVIGQGWHSHDSGQTWHKD